jgi:molybdopterin converting factor small subunit
LKLEVKYFGTIRDVAGKKEETIEAPEGTSLKKLFAMLSEKYGAAYADLLKTPYLRVFVDERLVDDKNLEQRIEEGSTVSLVLALHGG